ncbi:hypothetical protein JAAARDRAFT_130249 [Jaapia argillacea MUCL 33604]|uniref:pH-response regulator protein palC n=1 Tax=Jaapia argillacea MUCL 33604 TaxID=933084 RepID=A0A067PRJ6_9AGAM|nr:hypothetical protein JAAARDRAFT_130249 [Jaapia argillacea MUCL 33604]
MSIYLYELPTTGAVSFTDFCSDPSSSYTARIAEATEARANLRAALKESKRTDTKDYLRLVKIIDDYLPHLYGIVNCTSAGDLVITTEPFFSWRTTLSSNVFQTSPRLSLPCLQTDVVFTLITSAFALTNLARSVLVSLGSYEHQREILDKERKVKDDKVNFTVTLLTKAAGIFGWLSEVGVGDWEKDVKERGGLGKVERPVELSKEVCAALAKMSLADAQSLAIRKLLSKASYDSTLTPGPPLPKSHPSPALIAKLHLECSSLYSSARSLAKTPSSTSSHSSKSAMGKLGLSKGNKHHDQDDEVGSVIPSLRHYLSSETTLHTALAHKWLGVDTGERGRVGEAVGFLQWAKKELDDIKDNNTKHLSVNMNDRDKEMREWRKARTIREIDSVGVFLKGYQKMNDSISFQPVTPQGELQSLIPAGRLAVARREWVIPKPAFGPGSEEGEEDDRRELERLSLGSEGDGEGISSPRSGGTYAGSGSYF